MYFLFLFLLFPSALVARVTGLLKKETLRAMQKQKKNTHTHTKSKKQQWLFPQFMEQFCSLIKMNNSKHHQWWRDLDGFRKFCVTFNKLLAFRNIIFANNDQDKNNRGQIDYWTLTFNTSIDLPAKLIASLLTCTSLIAPTNDGTGAALPFVLLSILNPRGTPPTYQLSYNCIPFNFPLTSPFSCAALPIWSVPKGGSALVT